MRHHCDGARFELVSDEDKRKRITVRTGELLGLSSFSCRIGPWRIQPNGLLPGMQKPLRSPSNDSHNASETFVYLGTHTDRLLVPTVWLSH